MANHILSYQIALQRESAIEPVEPVKNQDYTVIQSKSKIWFSCLGERLLFMFGSADG